MEIAQCTDQWISEELVIEKYNKYKNMLRTKLDPAEQMELNRRKLRG